VAGNGVGVWDDEIFAGEEGEAAQHEDFVDQGIDDAAEGAFGLPATGEVAVEEISGDGDEVDGQGEVQKSWITAALVLIPGEHQEEDACQDQADAGQGVGDEAEHEGIVPLGPRDWVLEEIHIDCAIRS
jgi:hypothetical protein